MSIKDDFYINQINYATAEHVVIKCHYAHRAASCVYAFGLFQRSTNNLVGVVIYGIPANRCLCEALCGYDERNNIYELTRLYVDDGLPKNLESYFVGNTIKLLDREIIVSYSDTAYNHVGVIYQATNFIYTGLSAHRRDAVATDGKHNRHNQARICNGADAIERSSKHRYVYFNCNKRRKKELMEKLKYKPLPYPKQSCSVPVTSTENISDTKSTQRKLFDL